MNAPSNITKNYQEVLPGIYSLVPNSEYHSSEGLSRTNLCDIADYSVSTYLMNKSKPDKPSDPLIKGSAFHDLVLLPEEYHKNYLVGPTKDKRSKSWKEFEKDNPGKTIITPGMADDIHYMRDALYDNPSIREILEADTILREVSIWAIDPITELLVKIRPDIIVDGVIYDLKSSSGPHWRAFTHSVWSYNYHVQAVLYPDVAEWNGMTISDFEFLVVGSKPPYLTAKYRLNDDQLAEGEAKYLTALNTYWEYLNSDDKWDGLPYGRETVTL